MKIKLIIGILVTVLNLQASDKKEILMPPFIASQEDDALIVHCYNFSSVNSQNTYANDICIQTMYMKIHFKNYVEKKNQNLTEDYYLTFFTNEKPREKSNELGGLYTNNKYGDVPRERVNIKKSEKDFSKQPVCVKRSDGNMGTIYNIVGEEILAEDHIYQIKSLLGFKASNILIHIDERINKDKINEILNSLEKLDTKLTKKYFYNGEKVGDLSFVINKQKSISNFVVITIGLSLAAILGFICYFKFVR